MAYNYDSDYEDYEDRYMNKKISIKVPKMDMRNPYALDASMRKGGKMKDRREKRKSNPTNSDWGW